MYPFDDLSQAADKLCGWDGAQRFQRFTAKNRMPLSTALCSFNFLSSHLPFPLSSLSVRAAAEKGVITPRH